MIEVYRGLDAKIIWARGANGDKLWLGSANLARRAWDGRNAEPALRLHVPTTIGNSLDDGLAERLAIEDRLRNGYGAKTWRNKWIRLKKTSRQRRTEPQKWPIAHPRLSV